MSEVDPFRLRVLHALTALLETINPGNGAQFDLSQAVFRGRRYYGDNDPLPMLSILEPAVPPELLATPDLATVDTGQWQILIQGFVKDDPENPSDPAYHLSAAVRQVLAIERRRTDYNFLGMSGKVDSITIGQPVVRPADEDVSAKAYFYLSLTLGIVEDAADPYGESP